MKRLQVLNFDPLKSVNMPLTVYVSLIDETDSYCQGSSTSKSHEMDGRNDSGL